MAITEIKNILEGINSRICEAEERIRVLEDKMMEVASEEQNKVKRMKRISETSGIISNAPTFELYGSQKKRKRKSMRKFLKRL